MDRLSLIKQDDSFLARDGYYFLDCLNMPNHFLLQIKGQCNILLTNLHSDNQIEISIDEDSHSTLSIVSDINANNAKITANLNENSEFYMYFADFLVGENKVHVEINLNDIEANARWHLASLSSSQDKKQFDVSVYHNSPRTYALMDNYGVCKDEAKLVFSGVSYIHKQCHQSKTHQNAKIVVFDERCDAIAKPILKIDEHDIEASHAATVGKINDEHLFYLTSRGLNEAEAKSLITLGYLKPILKGFSDEEMINKINGLIESRM